MLYYVTRYKIYFSGGSGQKLKPPHTRKDGYYITEKSEDEDVKKTEPLRTVGGNAGRCSPPWKIAE